MHFGTTRTGAPVERIMLQAGDLSVAILTWGAIIQDVRLSGVDYPLTLGSNEIADYEGIMCHHGALIGPIANRISNARIKLDSMMYELERNEDGRIHLHSGAQATHRRLWTIADQSESHVMLTCSLPDGACGLPGHRMITATYRVLPPATLTMEITGTTDATTAMNFANHSYWNLDGTDTWDGHRLAIAADHYLPGTDDCYPTGEIADVTGTAMDFRKGPVLRLGQHSFDNNMCLSDTDKPLRDVLTLTGQSGLQMTMATTAPGLQIYDNKNGARPGRQAFEGLAFEAQMWPDAPNNPNFPSIKLTPDQTYAQQTHWSFQM